MDAIPDYSKCSLRELHDVAASVNRQKYPERYAAVLREIERRETSSDETVTAKKERPVSVWDFFLILFIMAGGALLGSILGALVFVIFNRPYGPNYGEGIGWGFAMIGSGMIGALVGAIAGMFWGTEKIHNR